MTTLTLAAPRSAPVERAAVPLWETEAIVLRGEDRDQLVEAVHALAAHLAKHPDTSMTDLAFTLNRELAPGGSRLAVVARSVAELRTRLGRALEKLADPACEQVRDTSGIYWFARPLGVEGKLAFLFPGEGAQYPGMLRDVAQAFPEAAEFLAEADAALSRVRDGEPAVSLLFLSRGDPEHEEALRRLDNAMLSVLLADGALHRVLGRLGVEPAFAAGHSMGEMAALSAAGAASIDEGFLDRFASTMKTLQRQEEESDDDCVLLAVGAGREKLTGVLDDPAVYLAMDNCPHQSVLIGPDDAMGRVQAELQENGLVCERLSFRRPYHTPLFEPCLGPLRELFPPAHFRVPRFPVYSCTTAEPFPGDPEVIRELAVRHWAAPLRFTQMIEAMHAAGARLFVEVGPRGNLSAFVEDILRGRRFAALPANVARRSGLTQLNHLVAQLAAHHVPMDLAAYYAPRNPTVVELARPAIEPVAAPVVVEASPAVDDRTAVMTQYLAVMEQFLDVQREVTETYLNGSVVGQSALLDPPVVGQAALLVPGDAKDKLGCLSYEKKRPLMGDIVRLVPGEEVVTRRLLDLDEDQFALDHTVGGRQVSRVDPEQHGVPVMPMTFTLEILAEAAGVLGPNLVVTAIRNIRLLRWLAFEFDEPQLIEVTAKLDRVADTGEVHVRAEIRDFGAASQPHPTGQRVASGTVVLAAEYPVPPAPEGLPGDEIKPLEMTVEQVYHNLFHGPMFQGVTRTIRASDVSIEASVEVLPRERLFRSMPAPAFRMDPVLLDVVLHPLATWHLHQPDLAGRIMLPVGVEAAEFYAPPAPTGTQLTSRSWISEANLRSFSHGGEVIAEDGSVYLRLRGVKCWRFYVPFGEVNFHGPKDQYFLGRRWGEVEDRDTRSKTPFALVRLEIPPDLKQPAMSRVTAQVTLTPTELGEFRRRTRENDELHRWLFDRIAAKDAVRLLWHDRTGERLYPADIECDELPEAVYASRRRGAHERFDRAVAARAGNVIAALATTGPACGLALACIDESLDDLRQRCAIEAVSQARTASPSALACASINEHQAIVTTAEGERWLVHFGNDDDQLVAWTLGERAEA